MDFFSSPRSKKNYIAMMLKSFGPNRFDPESEEEGEEEGEEEVEQEPIAKTMSPPSKVFAGFFLPHQSRC